ncbi:MAG: response regulator transcription factor [Terracidiphilus sp.]
MKQIRVLLVEDNVLARTALRTVLSETEQICVVGEAVDGDEGLAMYRSIQPDVLLLDLNLPRVSGFELITLLRAEFPKARIVVLSNYKGGEDIHRALRSGAVSYLTKDASGEELITAILSADSGRRYLPPQARDLLAERILVFELTSRESEVLACIARGMSNREIAAELGIAEKTARLHVSSVLSKIGVRDRTQAAIYALLHGFVHLD